MFGPFDYWLPSWLTGRRMDDIELPPSGPMDPRLSAFHPDYHQVGRDLRSGFDALKTNPALNGLRNSRAR